MSLVGLALCLALALPAPAASPGTIVLLAEQPGYRDLKFPERLYDGVLQRTPGTGKLGARFNPYRLAGQDGAGKPLLHELHVPEKGHLLAGLVGQQVRVTGKLVATEGEGKTVQEL